MLFIVASGVICIPHFLEYSSRRRESTGEFIIEEFGLNKSVYYKLIYLSLLDPTLRYSLFISSCVLILGIFLRITLPIFILSFTNIRILILIKVDGKKIYNVLPHEHHQVAQAHAHLSPGVSLIYDI